MEAALTTGSSPIRPKQEPSRKAPKRQRSMMSQVNARIETATKRDADAAFEHAGIAPSEAIRALYARAAALGSSLKSVDDLVVTSTAKDDTPEYREARFRRASQAFDETLARYGFVVDVDRIVPMTDAEIEDAMYEDYLAGDAR